VVCVEDCGDGLTYGIEICDDDSDDNVGCLTGCTGVNPLYNCTLGTNMTAAVCNFKCGDGKVLASAGEVCDDGSLDS